MLSRLAALALALALAGPAAAATPGAAFVFNGHGWGHGIGLSQYGALGYAQHGAAYMDLVAHYYPGTYLGAAPVSRIRVLLTETKKVVAVSSAVSFRVRDGVGQIHELAAGEYRFGRSLLLKLDGVTQTQLPGPLVFSPRGAVLELNGKPYRGTFTAIGGKTLQIVNTLRLEDYLAGVVPSEMPYFWNSEALKAQAIVARSYALATRQPDAPYDVFGDTRSQVYGGLNAEHPETTAAVAATRGTVVLYRGRVATTYFYSTSGGRTAAIQDEWQGSKPLPYLVPVADPYDTISPYHNWGPVSFTGAKLGALLKAPGAVIDLAPTANASGRVGSVTVTATKGLLTVEGSKLRLALGLRSTWFTVGELSLVPPAGPVVYGMPVELTANVKGLQGQPVLEQGTAGVWQPLALAPGAAGVFSATASPTQTTDFRLSLGTSKLVVRVPVSPAVALQQGDAALTGSVQPALAGNPVDLQRQDGASWTSVAVATVAVDGSFSAPATLEPGAYRAVVAAGGGLAAGTSPVLLVPGT
ncbi:MAG TPA: SpoIID/LytB domain-containing protein [Gaiellaceae bacterium]